MYTENIHYEWNNEKARRNALKHGVDFRMATFAFDDPYALVLFDEKHSINEARQWLIGESGLGILVVVFTHRHYGNAIRIISARKANRRERRKYEESKRI
jgi:uncharacterized DUF497 family protein